MSLKWADVIAKPEYQSLDDNAKKQARDQYWEEVIKPQIPTEAQTTAKDEFIAYTEKQEPSVEKSVAGTVAKTVGKTVSRGLGIAVGALNAPFAASMSEFKEQNLRKENPELAKSYAELNPIQKAAVMVGGMLNEAAISTFKKGEWGATFGDALKRFTGKDVHGTLVDTYTTLKVPDPERLASDTAPTVEMLGMMAFDPTVYAPALVKAFKLEVPKSWKGTITGEKAEQIKKSLEQLDKLEEPEKKAVQQQLTDLLKDRRNILAVQQDAVVKKVAQEQVITKELAAKAKAKAAQEATKPKTVEGLLKKVNEVPEQPVAKAQQVIPEKPVAEAAQPIPEKPVSTTAETAAMPEKPAEIQATEKANNITYDKEWPGVGHQWTITDKGKESTFTTSTTDAAEVAQRAAQIRKAYIETETLDKLNKFRESKGLPKIPPSTSLRSVAGTVAGVEVDDEGNVTFDPKKALAGMVFAAGGIKVVDAFKDKKSLSILSKYPAWQKVASGIGKERNLWTVPELLTKANKALFDRFAPLKKASAATYEAARKFQSYKDIALLKFRPLAEAFKPVRKDSLVMSSYVKAHRDMDRAARGLDNPGSVTLADAQQAIQEIESEWTAQGKQVADLKDTLDAFKQWTYDHILSEALDAGFISKAAHDDIVKNNKWYATYDIIDDMPDDIAKLPVLPSKEYFSKANQKVIKAMTGTQKQTIDPIEATIKKFTVAQYNFAQNRIASLLVDDPNMQSLIHPIASNQAEFQQMAQKGLDPVLTTPKGFDTINRFKNGEVEKFAVPTDIASTMKQLTTYQAPRWLQAYNAVYRATATTLSPAFVVRNLFRDALMAYVSSPVYKVWDVPKFAYDWTKGAKEAVKHVLGHESLVDAYVKKGGTFGWSGAEAFEGAGKQATKNMLFEPSVWRRAAKVVTSPFKLVEAVNEIVEMAPRLGTFDRAMKLGKTGEEAALLGRSATIDFNRGGTFTKTANQFVPFLNARVQGTLTVYEAFKTNPKQTSAKVLSAVILPGLAWYAYNRANHSDEYDDIPEYIRKDNFCLVYGKKEDEDTGKIVPKYLAIPKGTVGALFNPIEFALDKVSGKSKSSILELAVNLLSDLSPIDFAKEGKVSLSKTASSVVPPVLKAPVEHWANLKFYQGNEIVPYYMGKTKPAELQYKETTPEAYKWLGQKFGISPLVLQNYGENILTSYGRTALSPAAMLENIQGSIVKSQGGAVEDSAYTAVKKVEDGYLAARAYADEAVKAKNYGDANKIITAWNQSLNNLITEYNAEYAAKGFPDRGGLRKSYYFTVEKRRNIILKKESTETSLEKKLNR